MSIDTIASILMWVSGGVIAGLFFSVGFAIKVLIFMTETKGRLTQEEGYTTHFIKTGENIKEQISQHNQLLTEITLTYGHIKESIEDIKEAIKEQKR